jgi:hypothetical protein
MTIVVEVFVLLSQLVVDDDSGKILQIELGMPSESQHEYAIRHP